MPDAISARKCNVIFKILVIGALFAAAGCSVLPGTSDQGSSLASTLSDLKTWTGKVSDNLLRGGSVEPASERPSSPASPVTARSSDPSSAEDIIREADAYRANGDLASAAWDYARATLADPKSLTAQLRLGETELALQNDAAALTAFRAAQGLAPNHPEIALRLGEIVLARGDASTALDEFAIARRSRNDDPKLFNVIGVALTMEGNYKAARQNFEEGLRLKPDYPGLLNNLGLLELREGDLSQSLNTFTALVASHPTKRYSANRALVELALGQTAAALGDAPDDDEETLRQTLASYISPQTSMTADVAIHLETSFNPSVSVATQTPPQPKPPARLPLELSDLAK
jgi:Flp pilus assembly protein TadD